MHNEFHHMKRRQFIKQTGLAALGFAGLRSYSLFASERMTLNPTIVGYGPLRPDPEKILELPEGFSYQVIAKEGRMMTDGLRLPAMPDGMATFPGKEGRVILVMNHEVNSSASSSEGAFGKSNELLTPEIRDQLYDGGKNPMLGGTTTHIYNPATGRIEAEYLSLGGTERNCAGGSTPWGTWITCEETDNILAGGDWTQDHGYNFEVQATEEIRLQKAIPLKAMGRFRHEAVAVDPDNSYVYQTEDVPDGAIYRFIPRTPRRLIDGGRLQALAIKNITKCDTRNWGNEHFEEGRAYEVTWVDLDEVESPKNDLRHQAQSKGAAIFARAEGMWYANGEIYFACTNGGHIKEGQIFRYRPSREVGTDGGTLELFVESKDANILSYADNLTISNYGDVIIAEDTYDIRSCRIVGITSQGQCYHIARNAYNSSELAGVCFSPDYKTLFANIQKTGITIAIQGPWANRRVG